MSEDIKKIINELTIPERELLKYLKDSAFKDNISLKDSIENNSVPIKSLMSAAGSLASKNIIKVNKITNETVQLTDTGLKHANSLLPERKILNILKDKNEINMGDLSNIVNNNEVKIAVGWLIRKKWAKLEKGTISITGNGLKYINKKYDDEKLLDILLENNEIAISSLSDDLLSGLKLLKNRKNLIKIKTNKYHSFNILSKGLKILKHDFTIQEEATQLTHEDLKDGKWKKLDYRPYDITAEFPNYFPGKGHPLRRIIEEIREIFLNLGFNESKGPIVDSAFWNFDSLFQPQDHAAREMQDTFYVKNPPKTDLPEKNLVEKVANIHENGGETGSDAWNYKWDVDTSKQSLLRTHSTGISTRYLYEHEAPLKMFSVGRVFRRETITYKHLPEFHQVDGIIAGEEINYQSLLGVLKEFYKKLGFEVRFRPAYFPYTYLSTECEIYLEEKESWIELGGSGMFRPEVLEPLNINVPVMAFGLGIERLAMIRYDITDIRMLYKSDINWLRNLPMKNGLKLE
ncbi:MAG: phenylalanine--tRNA ligase subunit alpha [Methanobrevibacter sp.]|jgi:phenylalanyl-tRNA synthetase alpha chain|nr:phenylalanine--tRNA ligase subunit alpha [Candidatus Methanovirga meridionalis]